jgi:hypothetical protein
MAITFASTTDGEAGLQATMEAFGLEPEAVENPEPATQSADPAPPAEEPESKTAADPEPAGDQQETETDEEDEPQQTTERGEDGKFKTKEVPPNVQKKIDKATKARREAERRAEEADARVQKLQADFEELRKSTAAKPADVKPEPEVKKPTFDKSAPKIEDFNSAEDPYQAHQIALMEWVVEKNEFARESKLAQLKTEIKEETASEADAAERLAAFEDRKAQLIESVPDYQEVWKKVEGGDVAISGPLFDAIGEYAEEGLDVAYLYHLAKNPELLKRLNDATDYQLAPAGATQSQITAKNREILAKNRLAAKELLKLEAEVKGLVSKPEKKDPPAKAEPAKPAAEPAKPPTRASKAPPPIEPVRGGTAVTADPTPAEMSTPGSYSAFLKTDRGRAWYIAQGFTEDAWRRISGTR